MTVEEDILGRENIEKIAARAAALLGSDEQFVATFPKPEITEALRAPGMRLAAMMAKVMEAYADRPALAERAYDVLTDDAGRTRRVLLDRFDTITYAELWDRVGRMSGAWRHGQTRLNPGDFVCIAGYPSIDYTVLDFACIRAGLVSVPVPVTGTVQAVSAMIDEVEPKVFGSAAEALPLAVDALLTAGWTPGQLLVFDYRSDLTAHREAFDDAVARLADRGVKVLPLSTALDEGATLPAVEPHIDEADDNPMSCLIYTSGSTGSPKAAIHTERMTAMLWTGGTAAPSIVVTYTPLSHFYGRAFLHTTVATGGLNYFVAASDMSTLFDDIALARPTTLPLVPRVCEMIAHRYRGEIDRRVSAGTAHDAAELGAKDVIRTRVLGGRYLWASCSSAPLSPELRALMEDVLDAPLIISYGATEVLNVCVAGVVSRPPVIDYKLVDVPELNYFTTDKPHPRGELWVKTENLMGGYYKRPDLTAQMIDPDGFYHTGDIMAETAPDRLVYLDRRNNVLKLSQGEFVATSQLEATYASHPAIRQAFIHGDSTESFLLAVVVPQPDLSERADADLKSLLQRAINDTAAAAGLQRYEIPRDFIVEHDPFTEANKLLTGSGKLARPQLTEHYGQALRGMYTDIAASRDDDMRSLRAGRQRRSVLDTVKLAISATLGVGAADIDKDTKFVDIGGDSLSALSLSTSLGEVFEVDVPVSAFIDPTADVGYVADLITGRLDSRDDRPSFAKVHGPAASRVSVDQLNLNEFIDDDTLERARSIEPPRDEVRTVLVTGATGFLGRFQCLEWLERLAAVGGRVVCIARGRDDDEARRRVSAVFDSDVELAKRYADLADGHLEVLAGDLGAPRFGLSEADWARLTRDVDLVVHTGALVNHLLPYRELFGPNVFGTAEVLRLAMTHRRKQVTYVSTLAVAAAGGDLVDEDSDIRLASPEHGVDDTSYANGYAISKWAGEVLCREAHDWCGLPVSVFRCNMILAHSRYAAQLNVPDVFSRLILSLLVTGVAPQSFYVDGEHDPHYDGLPVDFIAAATTRIGAQHTTGFATFNVVNPHDDGVSLDTFVGWLEEAGHPMTRIAQFDDWRGRFETALRALPDDVRSHTMLNLLSVVGAQGVRTAGSPFSAKRFCAAVEAEPDLWGGRVPHVTVDLIRKYVDGLAALGYVPASTGSRATT